MHRALRTTAFLILLILAGCAAGRVKTCSKLAGADWTLLAAPPDNAAALLALENLPGGPEVSWFSKGPDRTLACFYATGLVNPSCGGSTAYEFARKDQGHWVSLNQRSEICPADSSQ